MIIHYLRKIGLAQNVLVQSRNQSKSRTYSFRRLATTPTGNKKDGNFVDANNMSNFVYKKHSDDDPPRLTCNDCGFIYYENPKCVVGSVATIPDLKTGEPLVLLCRRAIPPRRGYYNLPAGYMERNESLESAAAREAKEEATAKIQCGPLLSIYDIPHIGQVHLYFLATLTSPHIKAGYESLTAELFRWSDIPWDRLAFPTVSWALHHYDQYMKTALQQGRDKFSIAPFRNPVLEGHEKGKASTNIWYNPEKGFLFDDTWLHKSSHKR